MDDMTVNVLSGTPVLAPQTVALTFDDGPGPYTAELAQLLQAEGIPGTFFVLGESIEHYGEALDTVRDCGHAIELHSEYHRPFSSVELAEDQLGRCRARIEGYLRPTPLFRPPYGIGNEAVPGYAGPVGWHAHGTDWGITYRQGQTVQGCVDAITSTLIQTGGGVTLLHDFAPYTEFTAGGLTEADLDLRILEVVSALIPRLRDNGFRFVGL
jgi:peptidoglycan-N-acetylglucosamine deacetylase